MRLTETWVQEVIDRRFEEVELVALEDVGSRRRRTIRLYVDRPGGVDHDFLAEVSREVGAAFDDAGISDGPYVLEVSSPGLDRPLTKPAHFAAQQGRKVQVRTESPVDGSRVWKGELREIRNDGIVVAEGPREAFIAFDNVAKAHLIYEFDEGETR